MTLLFALESGGRSFDAQQCCNVATQDGHMGTGIWDGHMGTDLVV